MSPFLVPFQCPNAPLHSVQLLQIPLASFSICTALLPRNVGANADALLEQVSRSENVITIEQKYDPEDAAEPLYAANFALSLVLHLIDSLLGAKNAPAVLARLKEFNGSIACQKPSGDPD